MRGILLLLSVLLPAGCARPSAPPPPAPAGATLAQVYYWRAKPGKLEEYGHYITQFAERVDEEARREGAFVSVTTYVSLDSTSPWTHMRIFLLRDSTQLRGLPVALERAGARIEPDSARRRMRAEYSASLRDRVGSTVLELLR
ncbi:MAG TPA: hypothetical protein VF862_06435 [Gemmatimonadales bacterium]